MNKKAKAILCTASIVGVIGVAGVMAYLTDTDTATNTLTTGKVDIELQEPLWDAATDANDNDIPDYAENITPNATITKDPQVENVGNNNAYVYLKVTVPVQSVITANDDGTLKNNGAAAATELFSFELADNSKWVEIPSAKVTTTDSVTYVYYYNEAVAPNATTDKLFTQVKYANVIEGQNDLATEQIDVKAYAIQSDSLPADTTIPGAYLIYKNQNPNT